jgi:hypothetical protein
MLERLVVGGGAAAAAMGLNTLRKKTRFESNSAIVSPKLALAAEKPDMTQPSERGTFMVEFGRTISW